MCTVCKREYVRLQDTTCQLQKSREDFLGDKLSVARVCEPCTAAQHHAKSKARRSFTANEFTNANMNNTVAKLTTNSRPISFVE